MATSPELLIREARAARERARTARGEARSSADVAWRQRCNALALRMRTRELGPALRLSVTPERLQLKRVREQVREYATGRGADTEAVVLAAHEAVAYALVRGNVTTQPTDVELGRRGDALELRVRAAVAGAGTSDEVELLGLRLIAEFADGFEMRFRREGEIEVRATFAIDRP
jgi:hypothetical protein